MEIRESVSFEQVREEAKTIWYAVRTCWWTHKPEDVREATILASGGDKGGIPLDPSGCPLMFADGKAKEFLDSAAQNPQYYGKHGLRAFMAAHHRNAFENSSKLLGGKETGKPVSAKTWDEYNAAIDRFDSRQGASPFHEYRPVVDPPVYDNQKIVSRCVQCNAEFTQAQIVGANGCPACGDEGLPCSPEQDVTVKINWHELRIICIWAENYANSITGQKDVKGDPVKSVWAIASRLQDQYPSYAPLTLSGEIGQLREKFKNIEVHGSIREGGPVPPKIS